MHELTEEQRNHLLLILDIQQRRIWNNGRNQQLKDILHRNRYDEKERIWLNDMNNDYKAFCKHRKKSGDPNYTFWPLVRKRDKR